MKVGDLVHLRREYGWSENSLPIGLVIKINHEASSTGQGSWCSMMWDDGSVSGAWMDELRNVK